MKKLRPESKTHFRMATLFAALSFSFSFLGSVTLKAQEAPAPATPKPSFQCTHPAYHIKVFVQRTGTTAIITDKADGKDYALPCRLLHPNPFFSYLACGSPADATTQNRYGFVVHPGTDGKFLVEIASSMDSGRTVQRHPQKGLCKE